jgi:hypothetical protein
MGRGSLGGLVWSVVRQGGLGDESTGIYIYIYPRSDQDDHPPWSTGRLEIFASQPHEILQNKSNDPNGMSSFEEDPSKGLKRLRSHKI